MDKHAIDIKSNSFLTTLKEKNQEVFSKINHLAFENGSSNWLLCAHDDYITKWNLYLNSLTYVIETKIKTNYLAGAQDHVEK